MSRQRRQKFQYSIPMHMVERLPLIREESPNKFYANEYGREVAPYAYGGKSVRFLPEITSIQSPPPRRHDQRHRSPPNIGRTALHRLISDYMAYARNSNENNDYLPDIRHSSTCWCCSDRHRENLTKRNNSYPTSYEKLLMSKQKQHTSEYEKLLARRQNPERLTYEQTFRDDIYHYDTPRFTAASLDSWTPRRQAPGGIRLVPREYLIPEVTSPLGYESLEDYFMRLNHLDNLTPSRNLLDADELYRASMKKLRQQVHTFDRY